MQVLDYDLAAYPFPALVAGILGVDDLTRLTSGTRADSDASIYKNVQQSELHARLTEGMSGSQGEAFAEVYGAFLRDEVAPRFDEGIVYQARPTFRLIFADAAGVARFHRDSDYGHDSSEVNFSVALTPAFATNAIWIESAEGREDYAPIELVPGQYARFDGASLRHGVFPNETGRSRVSFDFRVVPVSRTREAMKMATGWPREPDPHLFASL